MRRSVTTLLLCSVAVLTPLAAEAQVYQLPTPAPQVTAASAVWQVTGEPVFHAGTFYYPTGPTVFFDGDVMRRTGAYRSVPLYEDSTLEPYSIVYVPIGRNLMRPYERRRDGELAGTAGSRTPSFPIQRDIELSSAWGTTDPGAAAFSDEQSATLADPPRPPRAVRDARCCDDVDRSRSAAAPAAPAGPTGVQSIPPPRSTDGVWIVYEDARWYLDGPAVKYDAARFSPVGNYRGFPVYRDSSADGTRIFVTVVPNGPVAPFARR